MRSDRSPRRTALLSLVGLGVVVGGSPAHATDRPVRTAEFESVPRAFGSDGWTTDATATLPAIELVGDAIEVPPPMMLPPIDLPTLRFPGRFGRRRAADVDARTTRDEATGPSGGLVETDPMLQPLSPPGRLSVAGPPSRVVIPPRLPIEPSEPSEPTGLNEPEKTADEPKAEPSKRFRDRLPKLSLKLPSLPFGNREETPDAAESELPALPPLPPEPVDPLAFPTPTPRRPGGLFRSLPPNRPATIDRPERFAPPSSVPRISVRPRIEGEF